jgi:sugar lactone lactonase YvrE
MRSPFVGPSGKRSRIRRRKNRYRRIWTFEVLESRDLLFSPSGADQEMLEYVNHFRQFPQEHLDVLFTSISPLVSPDADVNGALDFFNDPSSSDIQNEWPSLSSTAPLAWNESLYNAARGHSHLMIDFDTQSHQLPGEPSIGSRITNAGYDFAGAAENVFAFAKDIYHGHSGFALDWGVPSRGHRANLINDSFQEIGLGILSEANSSTRVGPLVITQNMARRDDYQAQLLGVVFSDNNNHFYTSGEGYGGVQIAAYGAGNVYTTMTYGSGGYQLVLPAGNYTIEASGGPLNAPLYVNNVTMGARNVKVDFDAANIDNGQPPSTAPVLDNSGEPQMRSILAGDNDPPGDPVAALIGGRVTHPFNGEQFRDGIAVTGLGGTGNGSWQYSVNGQASWTDFGAVTSANARLLRDTDWIRYVPNPQFSGSATISFRAWDQTDGVAGGVINASGATGGSTSLSDAQETGSVTVLDSNTAPSLDTNASPTLTEVDEDSTSNPGDLIADIVGDSISDPDPGALGIAVVATEHVDAGTWQYSLDNGTTWSDFGALSSSEARLLRLSDRIRFLPAANFSESARITFHAWDQTSGNAEDIADLSVGGATGGESAFSVATVFATVTVRGINDAPSLDTSNSPWMLPVAPGSFFSFNGGTTVADIVGNAISDIDPNALEGIAIIGRSGNGNWWFRNDGSWRGGDTSSNFAWLLKPTDKVQFNPAAGFSGVATFTFRAWDRTTGPEFSGLWANLSHSGRYGGTTAYSSETLTASVNVGSAGAAPTVVSLNRVGSSPTTNNSVDFRLTFSESVSNVDVSDFQLTRTDSVEGQIGTVSGSGSSYTIAVNEINGAGRLGLSFNSALQDIRDSIGNRLNLSDFTGSQTYEITNEEVHPPNISIDDISVFEGDQGTSNAVFTVRLSETSAATVNVSFSTASETASANSDYQSTTGSVEFTPGLLTHSVTIPIHGDTDVEGNESFLLHLSNASGGVIIDSQGRATIVDDDIAATGQLVGRLFEDLDEDGVLDNGEPGLSGWTIYLDSNADGQLNGGEPTAITDGNGQYRFEMLADGSYFIRQQPRNGWQQTAPSAGSHQVIITSGQTSSGHDFGVTEVPPAPESGEFQVNTYTTSAQQSPAVAMNPAGQAVAIWTSLGQNGETAGVYAQRYGINGAADGDEFQVNSTALGGAGLTDVAMADDGSFVVVWSGQNLPEGHRWDVYAQQYDSSGSVVGGEFRVHQGVEYDQDDPSIGMSPDGSFVIAWHGTDGVSGFSSHRDVFARRFNSAGQPQGSRFRVNSTTSHHQHYPDVGVDATGNFVIAWESFGQDGSDAGIYAQRFNVAGTPLGGEIPVNSFTDTRQFTPAVASADDGRFVVVWNSFGQADSLTAVNAQRFSSSGGKEGSEFRVNTTILNASLGASDADIAMAPSGEFLVSWVYPHVDGDTLGIFAQRYDATGSPDGGEFQVNTHGVDRQEEADVAIGSARQSIVVWQSTGQDGDNKGIFGQQYGLSLPKLAIEFNVEAFSEQAGAAAAQATVSRPDDDLSQSLLVTLINHDATELAIPTNVTIPANESSAAFNITAVDDQSLDGTRAAEITATAPGFLDAIGTIDVVDHETITIVVNQDQFGENVGTGATATVSISNTDDAIGQLVIDLSSSDESEATVPNSLTIGGGSHLYWVDFDSRTISRSNPDGSQVTELVTGVGDVRSVAVDVTGGHLYWSESESGSIMRANLDGSSAQSFVTGLGFTKLALDTVNRQLYWTDRNNRRIERIGLDGTGRQTLASSGLSLPEEIALDIHGGHMFWADSTLGKIVRADLDGSNRVDLVSELGAPVGVALDPANGKIYWTEVSTDRIQRANLDGSQVELLVGSIPGAHGLALDWQQGKMYWTDFVTDRVQRSNLDGSGVENIASDLTSPLGIALVHSPVHEGTFEISAVDDNFLDGTQTVSIHAVASGFVSAPATVQVLDRESLTLTLADFEIGEDSGVTTGTVTRHNTDIGQALIVTLASSDSEEATVPNDVTIPAGEVSTQFEVTGFDDQAVDGTQTVTISASATGYETANRSLDVTDHESLILELDALQVSEKSGPASVTGTVFRPVGDLSSPLVVRLINNGPDFVSLPEDITIPVNESSATFTIDVNDDNQLNGTRSVEIVASSDGLTSGHQVLDILDHEPLLVSIDTGEFSENFGVRAATLTVSRQVEDLTSELTVTIVSDDASELSVAESITIAAGATTATTTIDALDDSLLDGTQAVTLAVVADGYVSDQVTVAVTDHETLSVVIEQPTIREDAGPSSLVAVVTRSNTDREQSLVIALSSNNTDEAVVPSTVTIDATESSAVVLLGVIDDTLLDGDVAVTVFATADGYEDATSAFTVTDYEPLSIELDINIVLEDAGLGAIHGVISRPNTDLDLPLVVTLTSSKTDEAVVPETVTIPANESSVGFAVDTVEDQVADGTQTVMISATAMGHHDASANIEIVDVDRSPWQNQRHPLDVNNDSRVEPVDVLVLVNDLNSLGPRRLPIITDDVYPPPYLDTNGDWAVAPIDALLIINFINSRGGVGEGIANSVVDRFQPLAQAPTEQMESDEKTPQDTSQPIFATTPRSVVRENPSLFPFDTLRIDRREISELGLSELVDFDLESFLDEIFDPAREWE